MHVLRSFHAPGTEVRPSDKYGIPTPITPWHSLLICGSCGTNWGTNSRRADGGREDRLMLLQNVIPYSNRTRPGLAVMRGETTRVQEIGIRATIVLRTM